MRLFLDLAFFLCSIFPILLQFPIGTSANEADVYNVINGFADKLSSDDCRICNSICRVLRKPADVKELRRIYGKDNQGGYQYYDMLVRKLVSETLQRPQMTFR